MKVSMKYITTYSLFFCYLVYGVNFYVVGPTLIELAGLFQTTIEKISFFYTMRMAGYTIGSLSGFLFNYVNRQIMFCLCLTTMGITSILMPHMNSLNELFALAGLNGFAIGSADTAINVWMMEIWQEQSAPYMQALHFTYGLGGFIAPLICEPFLSGESIYINDVVNDTIDSDLLLSTASSFAAIGNSTAEMVTGAANGTLSRVRRMAAMMPSGGGNSSHHVHIMTHDPFEYLIHYPYAIAGALTMSGAAFVLFLFIWKKYEPPSQSQYQKSRDGKDPAKEPLKDGGQVAIEVKYTFRQRLSNNLPSCLIVWFVFLGALFLTLFVGMEQTHLQFLPTFAVNSELNLSPSEGALIASAAAAAFTIGRGVSIPLAIKLKPQTIIYTNHVMLYIGFIILAIYSHTSEPMMYVGNVLIGAGLSSVYASIYAFLERHITITNTVGSVFVFAGGLTAALSPSLVGYFIEENPLILIWFDMVLISVCFVVFLVMHLTSILSKRNDKKEIPEEVEIKIVAA